MSTTTLTTHTWPIVLAAGEGTRLRSLTTTANGVAVPKQFCSLLGESSLLDDALERARSVGPTQRVCTVVAAQHRHWWKSSLWSAPAANVIVQPRNQGTANGILLPLVYVLERDPAARIVLLPSDHYVRDEEVLARQLRRAVQRLETHRDEILLLGVEPEEIDPELGYVVPGAADASGVHAVAEFVEKPAPTLARALIQRGAVWNTFILAARADALLRLYERRFPELVAEMRFAVRREMRTQSNGWAIGELYERLPAIDFSRHVLEGEESALRLITVPPCGWSDLGTPERVAKCLARLPTAPPPCASDNPYPYVSLAAQNHRLQLAS